MEQKLIGGGAAPKTQTLKTPAQTRSNVKKCIIDVSNKKKHPQNLLSSLKTDVGLRHRHIVIVRLKPIVRVSEAHDD